MKDKEPDYSVRSGELADPSDWDKAAKDLGPLAKSEERYSSRRAVSDAGERVFDAQGKWRITIMLERSRRSNRSSRSNRFSDGSRKGASAKI